MKINNQTLDILRSCEENQICTINKIVTFEQKPRWWKEDKFETKPKVGNLYYVPKRHPKTGKNEVNTLLKKASYLVQINVAGL